MQHLISECCLMKMSFSGPRFTWSNNRPGVANVQERIDRVLVNPDWKALFPSISVIHEARMGSNHCPVVINLGLKVKNAPHSFKFGCKWLDDLECEEEVKRNWIVRDPGSALHNTISNLNSFRDHLLDWS